MGELRTRATMDDKPFRAGLDRMDKSVSGFNRRIGQVRNIVAGAFAVGGISAFARSVATLGSQISDLSTQTGVSTRNLQGLIAATEDAGGRQETLLPILSKVKTAIGRIARGEAAELEKAFNQLGISADQLAGVGADRALEMIGTAFVNSGRSAKAFSAVTQILGEDQGPKMIEVLERLARDGLDRVSDAAERTGRAMSDNVIQKMDEASDAITRVSRQLKVWGAEVGVGGVGLLEEAAGNIALAFQSIGSGKDPLSFIEDVKRAEAETLSLEEQRDEAAQRRVQRLAEEEARVNRINQAEKERAETLKEDWESYRKFVAGYEKLLGLNEEIKSDSPKAQTRQVDQLTRIGGMLGGRGNNDMSRLIQEQQRIRSHVAAIQRDVERQKRVTIAEP